ncbi:Putative aldo-keto reductase, NADP-dependent oxidoreductase domain-containing protein [Colletotrichum destructivum]|uniref:Aldo-keto reductase, NADP-dependent oxidoreductase domain-containing protein n=1 Tax=Colletotrichum destructivum TaxID=34406 RepID=A0AAX4HXT0_9PEZI|nr:Putative aldo-keto reductase, NADP-dependent oxidoreductase domain-containing protein [Colletotrichum destructivum]
MQPPNQLPIAHHHVSFKKKTKHRGKKASAYQAQWAFVPRIGLGVYQLRGEDCFRACVAALEAGYRPIDTAQLYGNEAEVGWATKKSLQQQQSQFNEKAPVKREDILWTTKMGRTDGGAEQTYRSALRSVRRVAGDDGDRGRDGYYVDL